MVTAEAMTGEARDHITYGLRIAILANNFPAFCALLDIGADPNKFYAGNNSFSQRALLQAAARRKPLMIASMLARGANPNVRALNRDSALHAAVGRYIRPYIVGSIPVKGEVIENVDQDHLQMMQKFTIEILLEYGANIDAMDEGGNTPLMDAIRSADYSIADFLIARGADINRQDTASETVLHEAVQLNALRRIDFCLHYGSDPNIKNIIGETTLAYAVKKGSLNTCQTLLHHGANILACDIDGRSCLALSLRHRRSEIFFLFAPALDATGDRTVLKRALQQYDHCGLCILDLISYGRLDAEVLDFMTSRMPYLADWNRKNAAGMTPLHQAVFKSNANAVELMYSLGANPKIKDSIFGWTPFHLAFMIPKSSDVQGWLAQTLIDGDAGSVKEDLAGWDPAFLITKSLILTDGKTGEERHIFDHIHYGIPKRFVSAYFAEMTRRGVFGFEQEGVDALLQARRQWMFFEGGGMSVITREDARISVPMLVKYRSIWTQETPADEVEEGRQSNIGSVLSSLATSFKYIFNLDEVEKAPQHDEETARSAHRIMDLPSDERLAPLPHSTDRPNPLLIYYVDKNGKCRRTQPLVDREEHNWRVWIIDALGDIRGVGGVDFDEGDCTWKGP